LGHLRSFLVSKQFTKIMKGFFCWSPCSILVIYTLNKRIFFKDTQNLPSIQNNKQIIII